MNQSTSSKVYTTVGLGVLTAIVVALQFFSVSIKFGIFSITLVLAPIIIGAALYGWWAGAWLGLVFGAIVIATGDANTFLAINVPGTIVTCLLKGVVAGAVAGLVYTALAKVNKLLAVIVAGIAAPVCNTGIFLLGCRIFFYPTIQSWAGDTNAWLWMVTAFVGLNFLVELGINMVLSTAIVRIIEVVKRQLENQKH